MANTLSLGQAKPLEITPAFICIYGNAGLGKTVETGYSFPNAVFLGHPNALAPIEKTVGIRPICLTPTTVEEATGLIRDVHTLGPGKMSALVVDDFSGMVQKTQENLAKTKKGFDLWVELRARVILFRDLCRVAGIHVVLNCWEKVSSVKADGTFIRGGPQLPMKLPEEMPAMCDLVLRVIQDKTRQPWGVSFQCNLDPKFVTKDRFGVVPHPAPMNLAEILREAGFVLPRYPGLEWQEEVAETIAKNLLTNDGTTDMKTAQEMYQALIQAGKTPKAVRWAVRDGLDRTALRRAKQLRDMNFYTI